MPLVQRTEMLMGNRFDIGVIGSGKVEAERAIEKAIKEIRRIEALLTTFQEDSQTNQINKMAGLQPVEVEEEVYALIERAGRISELTQGAFDLSYGSLDKSLWNFDQKMTQLPSSEKALKAVGLIDYRNIVLEKGTVFLKEKGMRIGFGGIGKGYAADRAKQVLQVEGFDNGVVNASGDMNAWGVRE
ncbi:MAG: FAD:protein FMN transferase, partial [Aquirufa sp.]